MYFQRSGPHRLRRVVPGELIFAGSTRSAPPTATPQCVLAEQRDERLAVLHRHHRFYAGELEDPVRVTRSTLTVSWLYTVPALMRGGYPAPAAARGRCLRAPMLGIHLAVLDPSGSHCRTRVKDRRAIKLALSPLRRPAVARRPHRHRRRTASGCATTLAASLPRPGVRLARARCLPTLEPLALNLAIHHRFRRRGRRQQLSGG